MRITGATGFIGFAVLTKALQSGYRVRIAVRREVQIETLKNHALIQPFANQLEGIIVPDITAEGAFDEALKDVVGVLHLASPLPFLQFEDTEKEIIVPAIDGTLSILTSALKFPQIKRVVITSSAVAIMTDQAIEPSNPPITYTAKTRITPLPSAPYPTDNWGAYRAAKALSLDATERFLAEKKPHFTIINLHPGYVVGRNELVTKPEELLGGSNAVALGVVLGAVKDAMREAFTTPITDLARIHVEALDDKIVESQSFLLIAGKDGEKADFNEVNEIAKTYFADAVSEGILNPVGSTEPVYQDVDKSKTTATFGHLDSFRNAAKAVIGQYVELKRKAAKA
ncbi:hypothetical protein HYALB_00008244 [Hymenoscyphus albidus]|uniref:NAD-dependent epimerase/dehydratase domain-containing protein n=1 Tax=Hymenoscyphus albidus TaxID=595503 RepID=A0A9N9LKJ5_9HELO|nr:hypothetical protein HYALB_00008244 [Hymenoscyphus albidus]